MAGFNGCWLFLPDIKFPKRTLSIFSIEWEFVFLVHCCIPSTRKVQKLY